MKEILVLNGPNLGRLGERDPEIYGSTTLAEVEAMLQEAAAARGASIRCLQSDRVEDLVEAIASSAADAIIINPASLTHHSTTLASALAGCGKPVYEVHISNIAAREPYRRRSLISPFARGTITGLGVRGYLLALDAAIEEE